MGPPSYMLSVVDRNAFLRRIPILEDSIKKQNVMRWIWVDRDK